MACVGTQRQTRSNPGMIVFALYLVSEPNTLRYCRTGIVITCTCIFRYYTSIPLADTLLAHATSFTGTAIKNRKELPSVVRNRGFTLQEGETRSFRDGRMLVTAWRAEKRKKPVILVSSGCSARPVTLATRHESVSKPAVVNAYSHSMNGVDIADQLTVFYSFVRRTRKWWRKVFFYLLEVSIVNSYLLYRQKVANPQNHLRYRRAIVEQLATLFIQQAPPRVGPGAPRRAHPDNSLPQRLDRKQHFIKKASTDRDCVVCSSRDNNRHRTVYYCNTCISHPHLCPDTCFEKYHTLTNYKR